MDLQKKYIFPATVILLFTILFIAYSNHFNNGFEFDDSHSIVHNEYIRDIKNIPLFFTGIKYQGTNPGNQDYRPVVATFHAIDYWLAGGLNSLYFHIDIFIFYIFQLVLMFFMIKKIADLVQPSPINNFFALLGTAFYGLHAASAETVNYICMRSDSFSTLCIVASFLLYMHPWSKKYYLYLISTAIGLGAKEAGAMFGAILFFYILLFEENVSLTELVTFKKIKNSISAFKKALPALIISFGLFYLIQKSFFPAEKKLIETDALLNSWIYFYTQWVVIAHYIGNFILPLDLSVDPDFDLLPSVIDRKVLLSLGLILSLVTIAFITSAKKETRPISFGLLWFFVALAPTSTIVPFAQVSNDHRTFFPFIGLVISLGWWLRMLYLKYEEKLIENKRFPQIVFSVFLLIICLHAYGTHQRNKVWGSSETLWKDAATKSPNNGRALMNHGLNLMAEGDYEGTLKYFKRTLELMPYWAYIHINMGILREAMGFQEEAEQYFKNAIRYMPMVPDGYYFYARWLHGKNRIDEAIINLRKGHEISPGHTNIKELLDLLEAQKGQTPEDKIIKLKKLSEENPSMANFIELSLAYYKNGKMKESVEACLEAIKLDPKSAVAYNNLCSAYNELGEWEKAANACIKALEIDPDFDRAKNNLYWAKKNLIKK